MVEGDGGRGRMVMILGDLEPSTLWWEREAYGGRGRREGPMVGEGGLWWREGEGGVMILGDLEPSTHNYIPGNHGVIPVPKDSSRK